MLVRVLPAIMILGTLPFVAAVHREYGRLTAAANLANTSWNVEQIDGVSSRRLATLAFGPSSHVWGSTGCKTYQGVYEQDGKQTKIHSITASPGSCDAMAKQHALLLAILSDVNSVALQPNGKLRIKSGLGRTALLAPIMSNRLAL